jgi:hypothetical protein
MHRSLILVAALLTACASNDQAKVSGAVQTPFNDLNLVSAPIPESLARAQQAPYGVPSDSSCTGLAQDIRALDADLGPDLDAPASESNPGLIERGRGAEDSRGHCSFPRMGAKALRRGALLQKGGGGHRCGHRATRLPEGHVSGQGLLRTLPISGQAGTQLLRVSSLHRRCGRARRLTMSDRVAG